MSKESSLDLSQQDKLSTFVAMTNVDSKVAMPFLTATSWNIETAIDRYYAFNGDYIQVKFRSCHC